MKRAKCEYPGCTRNATHAAFCRYWYHGPGEKLTCRNHPGWAELDHRPLTPAECKLLPARKETRL